jgi:hypothetical protein
MRAMPRPGRAGRAVLASGLRRCHVTLGRIAARHYAVVFFFLLFSFIELGILGKYDKDSKMPRK